MHLTTFTDYTLRVLIYLGARGDQMSLVTIGEIAKAYAISENHLTKVVHLLARRGYIRTTRGRRGGMALARPPERLNIGEIVRGTEENPALRECLEPSSPNCRILAACKMPGILVQANHAFYAVLDRYTLADLVRAPGKLVKILSSANHSTPALRS